MKVFLKTCNYKFNCHIHSLKGGHQIALKISRHFPPKFFDAVFRLNCDREIELFLFIYLCWHSSGMALKSSEFRHISIISGLVTIQLQPSVMSCDSLQLWSVVTQCAKKVTAIMWCPFWRLLSPSFYLCSLRVLLKSSWLRLALGLRALNRDYFLTLPQGNAFLMGNGYGWHVTNSMCS